MPSVTAANSTDTSTTRQRRKGERRGAPRSRGRRCIAPGSVGSKASTRPRVAARMRLTHRIWVADIGRAKHSRNARTTANVEPPFVDRTHVVGGKGGADRAKQRR